MNEDVVKRWLVKADRDLQTSKLCMTYDKTLTDQICYHAHQSTEKFLKAFLIFHNFRFDKTHNLLYLHQKCLDLDNEFTKLDLGNLNSHGTSLRYPESIAEPSLDEALKCLDIAGSVRDFILKKLKMNEDDLKLF